MFLYNIKLTTKTDFCMEYFVAWHTEMLFQSTSDHWFAHRDKDWHEGLLPCLWNDLWCIKWDIEPYYN